MPFSLRAACAVVVFAACPAVAGATWIWPGDVPASVQRAYAQHALVRGDRVYAACPGEAGGPVVVREYRTFVAWEHEIDAPSASDRARGVTHRERYDVRFRQARIYDDLQHAWGEWYPLTENEQIVFSQLLATRRGRTVLVESGCRRPASVPAG